jgi:HEAT repeat protein
MFWLGQKAGERVGSALSRAADDDPDTGVQKQAVFALSQMRNGEGVPRLIEVTRSNKHPAVRKQAMFWLGQSDDPRALNYLEEVLRGK